MTIRNKYALPAANEALPGREAPMPVPERHHVKDAPLVPPFRCGADGRACGVVLFGMGCFWGAERLFWERDGVVTTAVGYAGGETSNPTYEEVCSGRTGHTEAVLVAFDPAVISFAQLLGLFWESHDPTQGMRQGNDRGTQYRSAIFTSDEQQLQAALASRDAYQAGLTAAGYGAITTEIRPAPPFYYAEHYHQQYLAKVPGGYCGLAGTGVCLSYAAAAGEESTQ